ncbi:MAG: aromatic ring-hydroxylating dioxygenase subunit alpha [Pseudomonadota bacterium]
MSVAKLPPGTARCPGPSMQDIIATDGDNAPAALREQRYAFLGDGDLGYDRVTSQAFYDAEVERVWPRVWQWACREEHILNPGDSWVYDVGPYSVLVLRGSDASIRAFVNSCPHRGMQLVASGSAPRAKQFVRCPFHGMSWELDGELRDIPCGWDFPHVDAANFGLDPVRCEVWGGFVFINLDPNAEPLADYLGVLPEHFKDWDLGQRFVAQHTRKVLPANWKTAVEGFLEAYHILATHSQAVHTAGDANAQYDIFDRHVNRFVHAVGYPSPHLKKRPTEAELFAALGRDPDSLPAGASARAEHAARLRSELGAAYGTDLSQVSTTELLDSIEYFVFPNACFFPGVSIPLIYRFTPIDVDHCYHEILLLQPLPDSGERPAPAPIIDLDVDDSYQTIPDFPLGFVLDQDTENFKRQRAGIKASRKGAQTLGNYQEARIRHLHQTLDSYLAAESDRA